MVNEMSMWHRFPTARRFHVYTCYTNGRFLGNGVVMNASQTEEDLNSNIPSELESRTAVRRNSGSLGRSSSSIDLTSSIRLLGNCHAESISANVKM